MRLWMGNRYQNMHAINFIILCLVLAAMIVLTGCNEQQQTKVWGQGYLPAEWQGFFGEGNAARLDFVQTRAINKQGQAIAELAERVRKLEADPNDAYEAELKKRGL